ncbi:MAG: hypothetical protein E7426_08265 [Ruminococcaceae bacterium]|nr:hypothetical protein [Oscillospiraceae bacterium]
MEQRESMDRRRAADVWRRVAPELDPYPEERPGRPNRRPAPGARPGRPVPPPAPPPRPATREITEAEALRLAIGQKEQARQAYLRQAHRAGGPVGRGLEQLSRELGRQIRRLRSLYYMETGRDDAPLRPPAPAPAEPLQPFLRRRYREELASAEKYDRWAASATDACAAETLTELAEEDRRRARVVLRLLENRLAQ